MPYRRADTDWFSVCTMGIAVHWTAVSKPRHGAPMSFNTAIYQNGVIPPAVIEQLRRVRDRVGG